jgi:hypothetical protein
LNEGFNRVGFNSHMRNLPLIVGVNLSFPKGRRKGCDVIDLLGVEVYIKASL